MIVLGPVPCQGCRRLVTWDGWYWMSGKDKHRCTSKARKAA